MRLYRPYIQAIQDMTQPYANYCLFYCNMYMVTAYGSVYRSDKILDVNCDVFFAIFGDRVDSLEL